MDVLANPVEQFGRWYEEAKHPKIADRSAMNLATASREGIPSSRMVLLKDFSDDGFVFYTNLGSRKASELTENPHAALCFYWEPLGKQVRIEGAITPVTDAEADAYFASRDRGSQIGAWASKQSQPMDGMMTLERRVAHFTAKFNVGAIPRPEFWSGFRLTPARIEFWQAGTFRLHERVIYTRPEGTWITERVFP